VSADDVRARVDEAWASFRSAVASTDLDAPTSAGWQAKEMLAHVAFWLETVPPFVTGAFRGDTSAFSVTFPSGYVAGEDDWPGPDVHNAREAAWGREQSGDAVLARADRAYEEARSFLATVTDDEVAEHADYFAEVHNHLDEHRTDELTGA
jgi:hypothetical protein